MQEALEIWKLDAGVEAFGLTGFEHKKCKDLGFNLHSYRKCCKCYSEHVIGHLPLSTNFPQACLGVMLNFMHTLEYTSCNKSRPDPYPFNGRDAHETGRLRGRWERIHGRPMT